MTPRASLPTARLACASGRPWVDLLRLCLAQLDGLTDADDLGFVFMGDPVTDHADTILDQLVAATGIGRWVGAGGVGLFCGGRELEQGGALAVATLSMPERRLHLVQGEKAARRGAGDGRAILHLPCDHVTSATGRWDLGSIGGRLSSGFDAAQIAGGRCHAGVSGIRFEADTPFVAGLMHGTRPLGGWRPVTSSLGGRLLEIEGRPAAAVVAEEIGEVLARQPSLVCRRILIEVAGAGETGPEGPPTVERGRPVLVEGFDRASGEILCATERIGRWVRLALRDATTAAAEMQEVGARLRGSFTRAMPPRLAIYHACRRRGPELFGSGVSEAALLQAALGPVPCIGLRTEGELYEGALTSGAGVLALIG